MSRNGLSIREKVFGCMIMAIPYMKQTERTYRDYFEKYPVGGLFFAKGAARDFVEEHEGESHTTADVLAACRKASSFPLLVCADGANIGEGGLEAANAEAVGACHSLSLAREYGRALGMQMNANDIDWILGPAVDMPLSPTVDSVSTLMSNDPVYSAEIFREVIAGIQGENVAATVKHFPGLGTHHVNMHFGPGRNVLSFDRWMETYGYLYKELFAAGVMSIMTSHVMLPSFSTRADYGPIPVATYSKDLTLGLLKEKLGFEGAVVTDALTMGGCAYGDPVERSVAAFACGADLLLWPPEETADRIVEEIECGRIPMSRLDDACARIDAMRKKLGMTEENRVKKPVDPSYVDDVFTRVAEGEITLVKNEAGVLPLGAEVKRVLVVYSDPTLRKGGDPEAKEVVAFCDALRAAGMTVDMQKEIRAISFGGAKRISDNYDRVIFWFTKHPFDCFDQGLSAWSVHMIPKEKRVLVSFVTPHMLNDFFPEIETVVQMHSAPGVMSAGLLAEALTGKREMKGRLAVK